jgi:DnaJ-class molecular chaperone
MEESVVHGQHQLPIVSSFPEQHRTEFLMTLTEARELLGLELKATRQEIKAAYRRAARRWHPDHAPDGGEAGYRDRMQQINAAYHLIVKFIEDYRYDLVESNAPEDLQDGWASRFYTGVWEPPPKDND